MKYSVLVKPKVMIRINGIEADSQKEAALKAVSQYESCMYDLLQKDLENFNRNDVNGSFQYMEAADGELETEVLVDEEGDEEFSRSEWYLVGNEDIDQVMVDSSELRRELHQLYAKHRRIQKGEPKPHTVKILWGATPQLNETQPIDYEFDTLEEMNAFLHGVSECDGWLEYEVIEDPDNRCPVCFAELEHFEDTVSCSFDDEHVVEVKNGLCETD